MFVRLAQSGQLPPGKMLVLGAGRGYDARLLRPGGLLIMLAFPIGRWGGSPPYTVQPDAIIELYSEHGFSLAYREIPDDAVPARRGVEELLLLQKGG